MKSDDLKFREIVERSLPEFISDYLASGKMALVGGAIRSYFESTPINDFDLFCFSEEVKVIFEEKLVKNGFRKDIEYFSKYYKDDLIIEVVYDEKYGKNPEGLLDFMDFTITKACYTLGMLYLDPKFLEDIKLKRLTFAGSLYPRESYFRVEKYISYGYRISEEEIQKIISVIRNK